MSGPPPIAVFWDGKHFSPAGSYWARLAKEHFTEGEVHQIEVREERSTASHRHLFAAVREAWKTLPENIADQYPSPEHLRKRALVQAGFYDETITDAGSNAAALRVASAFRFIDDFAVVFVRGHLVIRRTAKSQSTRAMPKGEFQKSKDAVLEIVAGLIGATPGTLTQAGEAA